MIKHYLKASFASLWRRKWFSLLTLFSIAIAMVVVTCGASMWNMYSAPLAPEVHKDRTFYLATNLDRMQMAESKIYAKYTEALTDFLKQKRSGLKTPIATTAYIKLGHDDLIRNNKVNGFETMWTDDRFFQVFEFDFVAGKPYGSESAKDGQVKSCVLSDKYARWYFGDTNCVGKFVERGNLKMKVCGVVRQPVTFSEVKLDFYFLDTTEQLYFANPVVAFLCPSPGDQAALDAELSKLTDKSEGFPPISFKTTTSISRTLSKAIGFSWEMLPIYLGLICIALIIPALCLIDILKNNQINRSEELAVRRSFGAPAKTIAGLLLTDNLLITLLGGLLGLGFSFLFFGLLSDFSWSALFWVFFDWRAFLYYIAVFLIIGGIAGIFPAYRLAKQPIVNALNARDFERSQLGQIIKKRRRYYLPFAVLFLSFFALVVMLGMVFPILVRSLSLKLPVSKENRLELYSQWNMLENASEMQQQMKLEILMLPGVLAADFVINNLGDIGTHTRYDNIEDHAYTLFCGEDFDKVFDIKLEEGRWFGSDPDEGQTVVITRQHADFLGIKHLSNDQFFTYTLDGRNRTTKKCRIVGISGNVDNMGDMNDLTDLDRRVFPVFVRSNERTDDMAVTRLMIKMEEGYDFKQLNDGILAMQKKSGIEELISKQRLSTLDEVIRMQLADVWKQLKVICGILLMLLAYIFVALFGNFWKMTKKRTVEIGIRRAVGHTRTRVVWYLLSESLLFLAVVLVPATIIYVNIYPLAQIMAPLPVYLVSVAILLFIVLLATLIPAIYAGRIHPVEALAEE